MSHASRASRPSAAPGRAARRTRRASGTCRAHPASSARARRLPCRRRRSRSRRSGSSPKKSLASPVVGRAVASAPDRPSRTSPQQVVKTITTIGPNGEEIEVEAGGDEPRRRRRRGGRNRNRRDRDQVEGSENEAGENEGEEAPAATRRVHPGRRPGNCCRSSRYRCRSTW